MRRIKIALAALLILAGAALAGYALFSSDRDDGEDARSRAGRRPPPEEPVTVPGPNEGPQSKEEPGS